MIGGIVTETITLTDRVWINCVDAKESCNDHCAIYVERNPEAEKVKPGDSVWWQGGYAMWTPLENKSKGCNHTHHYSCQKVGVEYDIKLNRIGFSGVSRPVLTTINGPWEHGIQRR